MKVRNPLPIVLGSILEVIRRILEFLSNIFAQKQTVTDPVRYFDENRGAISYFDLKTTLPVGQIKFAKSNLEEDNGIFTGRVALQAQGVVLTVTGKNSNRILQYMNTAQVYFDYLPAKSSGTPLIFLHHQEIFIESLKRVLDKQWRALVELVKDNVGQDDATDQSLSVILLKGLEIGADRYAAIYQTYIELVQQLIQSNSIVDAHFTFQAARAYYSCVMNEKSGVDIATLTQDKVDHNPTEDDRALVVDIKLTSPRGSGVLMFSIDPTIDQGDVVHYCSTPAQSIQSWINVSDGSATLRLWYYPLTSWSSTWIDSSTSSGGVDSSRLTHSSTSGELRYDASVRGNQLDNTYVIYGGIYKQSWIYYAN
jgi:hypothetical protein